MYYSTLMTVMTVIFDWKLYNPLDLVAAPVLKCIPVVLGHQVLFKLFTTELQNTKFSQPLKIEMYKWFSENWQFNSNSLLYNTSLVRDWREKIDFGHWKDYTSTKQRQRIWLFLLYFEKVIPILHYIIYILYYTLQVEIISWYTVQYVLLFSYFSF